MIEREPINESLFLITDLSYVAIVNQKRVLKSWILPQLSSLMEED